MKRKILVILLLYITILHVSAEDRITHYISGVISLYMIYLIKKLTKKATFDMNSGLRQGDELSVQFST